MIKIESLESKKLGPEWVDTNSPDLSIVELNEGKNDVCN
jgi:hypothetical protein